MKLRSLTLNLSLLLLPCLLSAQLSKGILQIGGQLRFEQFTEDETLFNSSYLTPSISYFVSPRWRVGVRMDNRYVTQFFNTIHRQQTGVDVRYYLNPEAANGYWFGMLGVDFEKETSTFFPRIGFDRYLYGRIGLGYQYLLRPTVALELSLTYQRNELWQQDGNFRGQNSQINFSADVIPFLRIEKNSPRGSLTQQGVVELLGHSAQFTTFLGFTDWQLTVNPGARYFLLDRLSIGGSLRFTIGQRVEERFAFPSPRVSRLTNTRLEGRASGQYFLVSLPRWYLGVGAEYRYNFSRVNTTPDFTETTHRYFGTAHLLYRLGQNTAIALNFWREVPTESNNRAYEASWEIGLQQYLSRW